MELFFTFLVLVVILGFVLYKRNDKARDAYDRAWGSIKEKWPLKKSQ